MPQIRADFPSAPGSRAACPHRKPRAPSGCSASCRRSCRKSPVRRAAPCDGTPHPAMFFPALSPQAAEAFPTNDRLSGRFPNVTNAGSSFILPRFRAFSAAATSRRLLPHARPFRGTGGSHQKNQAPHVCHHHPRRSRSLRTTVGRMAAQRTATPSACAQARCRKGGGSLRRPSCPH